MKQAGSIKPDKSRGPLSIREFTRQTGLSERQVWKAIALGEVRIITFAGRKLIPQSEANRVKELIG